ncbi:MAG TPA: hypothetical protein VFO39_08685 [Candidatus Sulfotelmatobacter sp.]|nr:hypothetical protein [Candidatus Sulfotelmatobacter sp.]
MKHKNVFMMVAAAAVLLFSAGCGSYNLRTLTLNASRNELKGIGATLQLGVTAFYSNNTTKEVTSRVTFNVMPDGTDDVGNPLPAPPQTITVSATGLVTAVDPAVCTFQNVGTSTQPSFVLTGSYMITATFNGVTSQPVFIGVASAAGATGPCGP